MITVLHLITGLGVGGAEAMLAKLVSHSDRHCFRHIVVSMLPPGPTAERIEAADVPVHTLGMSRGRASPGALRALHALVRQVSPDVVQAWMYHANLLASVVGALTRVPVIWNIRSGAVARHRVAELSRFVARQPAAVVVNSEFGLAFHRTLGYAPRRWEVIPNGFDLHEFRPDAAARVSARRELGVAAAVPVAGIIARFDPQKDHRTFCRAAAVARQSVPGAKFVIIGTDCGPENPVLAEYVRESGLSAAVYLLGRRSDVPRWLNALDVLVSSSSAEGFSNTIGEGMACAVPCAVTDAGDSAAVVGDAGLVVPPADSEALGRAVAALLALDPVERQALGARARARVAAHFALERVVACYEELYRDVVPRAEGLRCAA